MNIKEKITISLCLLSMTLSAHAQSTLSGVVRDESGKAVSNVMVKAYNPRKRLVRYTQTNRQGEFHLATTGRDSISSLTLSCLSYKTRTILSQDFSKLKNIVLQDDAINIKEVVVKSVPIRESGDTLVYSVNAFKKGSDRTIEDVIKRLPGISVDNQGSIYYQGEQINRFYIENMDMLSGNYKLATRNIKPDDVSSVSVYENHQPVRALKNTAFSNKAALNLKIKENRKLKPIGYLAQAVGYDDQTLWRSDVFAMEINKKSQQLLSLKANDMGETYNTSKPFGWEYTDDFSSFVWDGISMSAQDLPSVSLNRYVDNKSGEGSLNSLFKLRDKQTLTINLRYAGDALHYQNEKHSSIFVGDDLYQDIDEKVRAAVYSNNLMGKIKLENNTDKLYFLDNLDFNAMFYHKRYSIEDYYDGLQRQKSGNYQLSNQFSTVINMGKKQFQFRSNIKFSNTPVNRLASIPLANGKNMTQSLEESVFQTNEHTSFGWGFARLFQMGVRIDFESYYNKISLDRQASEGNLGNTFSGYLLNTSAEPYIQARWEKVTWEIKAPLSLLNINFKNKGDDKQLRLDKAYANVSTSISWNMLKGTKLRVAGGSRCNFGDISNFVTSPIYYTYKDVTTKGTGDLSNRKSLFANCFLDYHNTIKGLFASLMGSISRSQNNSMRQTDVSDGNVYSNVSNRKNTMIDKLLNVNISQNIRSTNTSIALTGDLGNTRTHILSKDIIMSLENNRYMLTAKVAQSLWDDKINLTLEYSYLQNKNSIQNVGSKMQEHIGNMDLSLFLLKDLEIFGDVSLNWLKEEAYKEHKSYANAGIRYKWKSFEWELLAQNLTNQNKYIVNRQVNESNYRYIYYLRPIGISLSVKYNF